ncbi:MAG: GGDEF domain-containing protein [Lachnospiraceae bacterium]
MRELLKWFIDYGNGRMENKKEYSVTMLERIISVMFFMCHAVFILMFLYAKVYVMVIFNIGSLTVYVISFFVAKKQNHRLFFYLSYFEVILHAIMAVWIVGRDSNFSLYCVATIPLAYICYYELVLENQSKNFYPFSYTLISSTILIGLKVWNHTPVHALESKVVTLLSNINYGITIFACIFFMSTFIIFMLSLQEELMKQNMMLEMLSMTDTLTGLSNRRIVEEFEHNSASKESVYCVIIADIDDFKKINDTYGHDCGDAVLVMASNNFQQSIRKNDIVCRWGGEEFLLILPFCGLMDAEKIAQKIQNKICSAEIDFEQYHVKVSMTYGLAESTEGQNVEEVIRMADKYLYYGKQHGKNQVVSKNKINLNTETKAER